MRRARDLLFLLLVAAGLDARGVGPATILENSRQPILGLLGRLAIPHPPPRLCSSSKSCRASPGVSTRPPCFPTANPRPTWGRGVQGNPLCESPRSYDASRFPALLPIQLWRQHHRHALQFGCNSRSGMRRAMAKPLSAAEHSKNCPATRASSRKNRRPQCKHHGRRLVRSKSSGNVAKTEPRGGPTRPPQQTSPGGFSIAPLPLAGVWETPRGL